MESIKKFFKDMVWHISALGSFTFFLITVIFFALLKEYETALFLITGLILAYIITFSIRAVYHKERPVKKKYSDYLGKVDASSFPSQHANRITFLSLVLIRSFNQANLIFFFILLASGVVIARYILKRHYAYDLIAGALLGVAEYYLLVWLL